VLSPACRSTGRCLVISHHLLRWSYRARTSRPEQRTNATSSPRSLFANHLLLTPYSAVAGIPLLWPGKAGSSRLLFHQRVHSRLQSYRVFYWLFRRGAAFKKGTPRPGACIGTTCVRCQVSVRCECWPVSASCQDRTCCFSPDQLCHWPSTGGGNVFCGSNDVHIQLFHATPSRICCASCWLRGALRFRVRSSWPTTRTAWTGPAGGWRQAFQCFMFRRLPLTGAGWGPATIRTTRYQIPPGSSGALEQTAWHRGNAALPCTSRHGLANAGSGMCAALLMRSRCALVRFGHFRKGGRRRIDRGFSGSYWAAPARLYIL